MKYLVLLSLVVILSCNSSTDKELSHNDQTQKTPHFDSTLAKKVGADAYGMRTYVMAFLKKGSNRTKDSLEAIRLQSAHMANIGRMAEEGKLVLAGPFYGNDSLRGIYIFDTPSLDSAKKWTSSDPAIQQKSLKMDLKLWYGSAALMQVNEIHKKISKEEI